MVNQWIPGAIQGRPVEVWVSDDFSMEVWREEDELPSRITKAADRIEEARPRTPDGVLRVWKKEGFEPA